MDLEQAQTEFKELVERSEALDKSISFLDIQAGVAEKEIAELLAQGGCKSVEEFRQKVETEKQSCLTKLSEYKQLLDTVEPKVKEAESAIRG